MKQIYKTLLEIIIWILFAKGILLIVITLYATAQEYLAGKTAPIDGLACCATGTFAFAIACVAIFIRKKVE
jgi:hypothetical protein